MASPGAVILPPYPLSLSPPLTSRTTFLLVIRKKSLFVGAQKFPFRILPLAHFWIFGERLRLATASLGFRYPAQV
ncbi:hypothetical protein CGMCC3_g9291 [Colletotrichum fructicola]|nr:uncharacterized protein CGMCC3_g9291 [Colletotrichum fructicola]KAE9574746.1 hypothetical protein CGMCC3_g9291 [Colletotrichum fructicola]